MKKVIVVGGILLAVLLFALFFHNEVDQKGIMRNSIICPKPLLIEAPVDLKNATSILYPGQVRGGDYKRHGGFRFDSLFNNRVDVRAPIDATLISGSRYLENGNVQYMLDFETECGIKFRFDHLLTLAPQIVNEMEKLPKPKERDSRTTSFQKRIFIKKGEIIAMEVGEKNNVFVDFGVCRIKGGINFERPTDNPICWFDLLQSEDEIRVRSLPSSDGQQGKKSDVCE